MSISIRLRLIRAILFSCLGGVLAVGPTTPVAGEETARLPAGFHLPEIRHSTFSENLGLMSIEREDMAEQLAGFVINELSALVISGDREATALAEKLLGLALHLDPRNRSAVVASFQLARGIQPDPVASDYRPDTLSELFLKRSDLLARQEGEENILLGAALLFSAAEMNPKNTEAVFRHEMRRREGQEVDWTRILRNGD